MCLRSPGISSLLPAAQYKNELLDLIREIQPCTHPGHLLHFDIISQRIMQKFLLLNEWGQITKEAELIIMRVRFLFRMPDESVFDVTDYTLGGITFLKGKPLCFFCRQSLTNAFLERFALGYGNVTGFDLIAKAAGESTILGENIGKQPRIYSIVDGS